MADHVHVETNGAGPAIVCIHGFTQTGRCWGPVRDDLERDHRVVAVDAPGHGGSSAIRLDLEQGAAAIGDAAGPGTYVGYSMGGRYALRLALDRPDLVERLVLIGASPGLEQPVERAQRRRADEQLADELEQIGVAAFIDRWLRNPLFVTLPDAMRCVRERLTNDAAGLASSLRLAGTGAQEPVWSRLAELDMPVLVVAGALDTKFTTIGERMVDAIGTNARFVSIPQAGHTAHLEQPDAFLSVLRAWLAAC